MDAELRKTLSKLVLGIRHLLEGYYEDSGVWHAGDLEQRLNQIGVWRDRTAKPLEELPQLSEADKKARRTVDAYIKYREDTGVSRAEAVEEFIRESTYTWFNRLFALRCMEARGIIDEVILQKDIYGGRSLQHNRLAIYHPELCAGEDDGLFAVLFLEFERRAHELSIFFNLESPAVALKPSVSVVKRLVSILSGREPVNGDYASDETFMAPDAFGWAYQYWNAEEKDRVFERVRTEKAKIEGKDIIPVTCIYTEPYMVKFLVQNGLGAQWCCMHPESRLHEVWEYYVKDADRSPVEEKPVREITFLDPACGSGHFLLEAFDLYYEMYSEEGEFTTAEEICSSILENNLFGIDIDERAVQISVAVLWMKAKEKAPRLDTSCLSGFHDHLVATNIRLPRGKDHLKEFLREHPEDSPLKDALESIFEALENVDEIGSLLKIEEPLKRAFEDLKTDVGIQTTLWSNGFTSLDSWRENVIEQLKDHFNEEAVSADLSQAFFGLSMNKGLRLIDLLSDEYDVVATNPPYMSSGNMSRVLNLYLKNNYEYGKYDLYSSFIIRCIKLTKNNGCISMITQHSWMFLRSYVKLRIGENNSGNECYSILRDTNIDIIAHLGTRAFSEISGEVVNVVLFTLSKSLLNKLHTIVCFRLLDINNTESKKQKLMNIINSSSSDLVFKLKQNLILQINESPILYWLNENAFKILINNPRLEKYADVVEGLGTRWDDRFIRTVNEVPVNTISNRIIKRWFPFVKGGGYCKWYGLQYYYVDWQNDGVRIRNFKDIYGKLRSRPQNIDYYFKKGYTYTSMAQGSLGVRLLESDTIAGDAGPIISFKKYENYYMGILNSRYASYILNAISPTLQLKVGYIKLTPLPNIVDKQKLNELVNLCIEFKKTIISKDLTERFFKINDIIKSNLKEYIKNILMYDYYKSLLLHMTEAIIEIIVLDSYKLDENDIELLWSEKGKPVGLLPFLKGDVKNMNILNNSVSDIYKNAILPREVQIDSDEIKSIIKKYYENSFINNDEELYNINLVKYGYEPSSPFPFETHLEKISLKMKINPLSIFIQIKEGIEQEKWRCLSEEQRIVEDLFSVFILQLLGHRWPNQIEACEPIAEWVDPDGIIPIIRGTTEPITLDRIRERIIEEFEDNRLTVEREFEELMGKSLEEWLLHDFFKHHTSQFKKRPVAWQIQSTPPGISRRGRGQKVMPAFACLVYCQKVDGDTLHKIRSQYVEPLKNKYEAELRTLETIGLLNTDQTVRRTKLEMLIDELAEFDAKLQKVITEGFDSKKLRELIEDEPLDKWCSIDGEVPPLDNREELYLQERVYVPDINDGVRVNIAPLQKAGLLASDVLASKDVDIAISDRAEWRADERRWCREGKLPQPGWWEKRKLDDKPR